MHFPLNGIFFVSRVRNSLHRHFKSEDISLNVCGASSQLDLVSAHTSSKAALVGRDAGVRWK